MLHFLYSFIIKKSRFDPSMIISDDCHIRSMPAALSVHQSKTAFKCPFVKISNLMHLVLIGGTHLAITFASAGDPIQVKNKSRPIIRLKNFIFSASLPTTQDQWMAGRLRILPKRESRRPRSCQYRTVWFFRFRPYRKSRTPACLREMPCRAQAVFPP